MRCRSKASSFLRIWGSRAANLLLEELRRGGAVDSTHQVCLNDTP